MNEETIRQLIRQSVGGFEREPSLVLADALMETDRPDLGEDLALVLADRMPFPYERRGQPIHKETVDHEQILGAIFRRIHRHFAWNDNDRDDRKRALYELAEIETDWRERSLEEREEDIESAVSWLVDDPIDEILDQRTRWLFGGDFGRGAQILADEIADGSSSRLDRVKLIFRIVLALDDRLPLGAADLVWRQLPVAARNHAAGVISQILAEQGAKYPKPSRSPRAKRTSR